LGDILDRRNSASAQEDKEEKEEEKEEEEVGTLFISSYIRWHGPI
jgi:hypothetical protein